MIEHKHISIDEIILLDENPRNITDEDLQKLCEDIEHDPNFLYQRPSLINHIEGKYYCYAGSQRVKAQKILGHKTAICFVEDDVPERVQRERMVKDNLHRGVWDQDKLLELDFEMQELEDFGFDLNEISLDVDTSILDDLKENAFVNSVKDEAETFGFTLQIPKEYKEASENYVKSNTKAPIVEQVIKMFKDA